MKSKTTINRGDAAFKVFTGLCAAVVLVIIAGMIFELVRLSSPSIARSGLGFFTSREWNPVTQEFGALTSIYGTLVSTAIAMIIAVPLSVIIALFLVELAPPVIAKPIGYAVELLAAIPSIIYGMWGLFVFAPFLATHVQPFLTDHLGFIPLFQGPPIGIGMFTAGLILALMILPFVSAVMRDVFLMVPPVLKEASYGVGSTTWETTSHVTMRYGISGLIGASFLGLGRAIGETMAVTFVIGNDHSMSLGLFNPANTIASTLANEFAEASEPIYQSALVELGLVLLVLTLVIQALAQLWLRRIRKGMGEVS
jgi:phosphate transport system permease protein